MANEKLLQFRERIIAARSKLIAHTDVASRLSVNVLGAFDESEEREFWSALQHFASTAHGAACGGPFEIVATMPQGDGKTLVHCLIEAVDYGDLIRGERGFLMRRVGKRRYENA